jgi:hypothetical protein
MIPLMPCAIRSKPPHAAKKEDLKQLDFVGGADANQSGLSKPSEELRSGQVMILIVAMIRSEEMLRLPLECEGLEVREFASCEEFPDTGRPWEGNCLSRRSMCRE